MFEHSVKVPRHYKVAANIFKKAYTEGGSVKTLLYDEKLRHFRTNVLYALITETIKHAVDIEKMFESCEILTKEPRLDPWLAKILAAELLFGKKTLPGKSKPELTILSYKEQLEKNIPEHQDDLKSKVVRRPRYVRINTNLLATSDAIRAFQDEGYKFIRCTSGTYDDYLQQIQSLTEYDFTQDYHVKTMFVFAPGTKLHEHDLYLENQIILQDKATALAVHLLAPPSGSTVLDMCAAPGMKTTQCAAYLRNQGKVYAVERNEDRYKTLCDFVEKTGSKCVETLHKDSLEIKRGDCEDVEYILLDPSCSGSGMDLHVHNYIEDTRLARLTSLQEKFLKHAMNSFPNAKRIVYSTCSLFPEENERVITNVVKTSRAKWRVQDVKELLKGQWNNFGSGMYGSMGTRCLYAVPNSDFTTGFFLAVLDRDPRDMEKSQESSAVDDKSHSKTKHSWEGTDIEVKEEILSDVKTDKKVKKEKIKVENDSDGIILKIEEEVDVYNEHKTEAKEKRKKKEKDTSEMSNEDNTNKVEHKDVETKKKKKKRKMDKESSTFEQVATDKEIEIKKSDSLNDNNINEITKKKKKRKTNEDSTPDSKQDNENSIYTEEQENINDNDVNIKTTKKKKRKTNEENSTDVIMKQEHLSKKARKKYNIEKHEDDSNEYETITNNTVINNNDEPVKPKKKKKKDKTNDLTENVHEIKDNSNNKLNDEDKGENLNKKKKNKSKNVEESETNDMNEVDEAPKKKKIRKAF
ncbi:28S rRNA (cytosine-C(5))-methyltransferase [Nymphalis io]|uniref:28S rRNA (cytosine-C(5))-methyltransferase n=1 Tax=Inachis io TaxID=171585 RepID=UPI0021690704|nr:28S rRNA (cytosine-C(5))-methyltransferase [Nymphalis io]